MNKYMKMDIQRVGHLEEPWNWGGLKDKAVSDDLPLRHGNNIRHTSPHSPKQGNLDD